MLRFNQQSDRVHIELTFIPERDYNAQVQAAALANDLPDILEFDGPYLYNYIWQNQLRPLDELLPAQLISEAVRPLPLGIAAFFTLPPLQWGEIVAFGVMMVVPVLLIFVVFQN